MDFTEGEEVIKRLKRKIVCQVLTWKDYSDSVVKIQWRDQGWPGDYWGILQSLSRSQFELLM